MKKVLNFGAGQSKKSNNLLTQKQVPEHAE